MDKAIKLVKILFVGVFIIHSSGIGFSQSNTFIFKYSTLLDEIPTAAIETPDGSFIISAKQGDRNIHSYHTLLIKINSLGDTVKTTVFSDTAGNCYIYEFLKSDDGNYFAIGTRQQSVSEESIWLLKIDENLTVIWEKTYQTNCSDLSIALGFMDHNGNIIIYSDGYTGMVTYNDLMVYKVNQNGDSLFAHLYPSTYTQLVWSMIEKPYLDGYYMMITGRYLIHTYSLGQLLNFDPALNIINIDSIPSRLKMYYNSLVIKNNFIVTGLKIIPIPNQITPADELGILKLDTSYTILNEYVLGSLDTASYPGYIHNLDTVSSNIIYYGGTFNQDRNLFLSPNKSWFTLAKFDSSLNLKWQKFYGGDIYYGLWGVTATSDGGCLLIGTTYDFQTQFNEEDIIVIKVDSCGIYTSVNNNLPFPEIYDAIVYPNPGNEEINVRTGFKNSHFELVNILGKTVLRQPISHRLSKIHSGNLPEGIYFYRICQGKIIKESGKWIKE